ncbi:MAG: hypothetical protein WBF13_05715 [Candidatus Zixiibacteriota bacterium]
MTIAGNIKREKSTVLQRLLLLGIAISLTACENNTEAPGDQAQQSLTTEEYAVYASVMQSLFIGSHHKLVVIRDSTVEIFEDSSSTLEDPVCYDHMRCWGFRGLRHLKPEFEEELEPWTLLEFLRANKRRYLLADRFELEVQILLISGTEHADIFRKEVSINDRWREFYARYPDSPGQIAFSRVGFNRDMNQAFLYAANASHWLVGAGYLVLLTKEDNAWKILRKRLVWVS